MKKAVITYGLMTGIVSAGVIWAGYLLGPGPEQLELMRRQMKSMQAGIGAVVFALVMIPEFLVPGVVWALIGGFVFRSRPGQPTTSTSA